MKQYGILIIGIILGVAIGVEGTILFIRPVSQSQFNELRALGDHEYHVFMLSEIPISLAQVPLIEDISFRYRLIVTADVNVYYETITDLKIY